MILHELCIEEEIKMIMEKHDWLKPVPGFTFLQNNPNHQTFEYVSRSCLYFKSIEKYLILKETILALASFMKCFF